MKASLVQNVTTKQYEFTVLDNYNSYVFDVVTPFKNRLQISNCPHITISEKEYMTSSILQNTKFKNDEEKNSDTILKSFLESNPITKTIIIFKDHPTRNEELIIFHPIKKYWLHPFTYDVEEVISLVESIQLDMINHILEFDRQEQMLKCLEHLATRQTVTSEIGALIKSM